MHYTIEQLVDERNRSLHEGISSRVTLELVDEPNPQEGWGSQYFPDKNLAQIMCSPAELPQASFTHELLHVKFELDGYLRPKYFNVSAPTQDLQDYQKWAGGFLVYAYNQMMHLKMYPEFVKLGYPPIEFLKRNPTRIKWLKDWLSKFKEQVKKNPSKLDLETYARTYLAMRNPHDPSPEIPRLMKEMKKINSGRFNRLEKLVDEWLADESPNLSAYLARLFYCAGHPDVCVGNSRDSMVWGRSFASEKK